MANLHNIVYSVSTQGSTDSSFNKMFDTIEKLSKTIDNLNKTIIDVEVDKKAVDDLKKLETQTEKTSSKMKGLMEGMNEKMAGFAGNMPVVGVAIEKAMLALGPYGVIISGIVAGFGALGAVLFGTSDEIDKVKDNFRGFAESEETLTKMTNSSRALQKTFEDFDAKVYADNVKVLSNEFGISQEEANRLNEEMVKLSGNTVDPDNVREYATQFAKLGLSANEFSNSLINQKSMGIYMDKGVDSVKELGLRMNKMSDLGKQAFANVGINIDDMSNKVNKGKMRMSDMLSEIGKKMGKAGSANKQTLITEAFGSPGEDAGKNLDKYLQSFESAQSKMTKADEERFNMNKKLVTEQEKSTKGLNVLAYNFSQILGDSSSKAWSILKPFSEFFINAWYEIGAFIDDLFGDMGVQLEDIVKYVEWVLNHIGNVFEFIGKVIKTIVAIGKTVYTVIDVLLSKFGGLSSVWDGFLDGMTKGIKWIGYLVDEVGDLFNALTSLAKGDYSNASKFMKHASLNDRALGGDAKAIEMLQKESDEKDKQKLAKRNADTAKYEIKKAEEEAKKKAEEEALKAKTNNTLNGQIAGSLTNSATGATSSVKNISINFEALQKIMGNQILGEKDSRRILDDMNDGFMQILNNTNQISTK